MKLKRILLLVLVYQNVIQASSSNQSIVHTIKSVASTLGSSQFWSGLAQNFGAAPTGYTYSCQVYNDLLIPVSINIQEYASFMGATFPKSGGYSTQVIESYKQYVMTNQPYYFSFTLTLDANASVGLPYSNYGSCLYEQDCTQLQNQNSTQVNYFRTYMGKTLQNGSWIYNPGAEYLGYADPSNTKDKGASVTTATSLSALVVYNNTAQDLVVGYGPSTINSPQDCTYFFTTIQNNSFALYNGLKGSLFGPGSLAIFKKGATTPQQTFNLPTNLFGNKTYTIEIYQQGGDIQIGLQGLMPGNFDMPIGRIRDITPIICEFWYQSAAQNATSGFVDLPGQVWVVTKSDDEMILSNVTVGTAVQFQIVRPKIGEEKWIYFIYVQTTPTTSVAIVQKFVENVFNGIAGASVIQSYQAQAAKEMSLVKEYVQEAQNQQGATTTTLPQNLIVQAMQGSLQVNQGLIMDTTTGLSGYLLGADVFLANGCGSSNPFFYQLGPSLAPSASTTKKGKTVTAAAMPTSYVANIYAQTMGSTAPNGMPSPSIINGAVTS